MLRWPVVENGRGRDCKRVAKAAWRSTSPCGKAERTIKMGSMGAAVGDAPKRARAQAAMLTFFRPKFKADELAWTISRVAGDSSTGCDNESSRPTDANTDLAACNSRTD